MFSVTVPRNTQMLVFFGATTTPPRPSVIALSVASMDRGPVTPTLAP